MKSNLKTLFSIGLMAWLSVACGPLFNGKGLQSHDVVVSLKNGTPCFSVDRKDRAAHRDFSVHSIEVWEKDAPEGQESSWETSMYDPIWLKEHECIPYGERGTVKEEVLKKNTLYFVAFSMDLGSYKSWYKHSASGVFCLLNDKNGKTLVRQYKYRDAWNENGVNVRELVYDGSCSPLESKTSPVSGKH